MGFASSSLKGIRRALPRCRPGVCGLRTRRGVDSILTEAVCCCMFDVVGLASSGREREERDEVFGTPAFFGLLQALSVANGEFSLSTADVGTRSVLGRTRTGEPSTDLRRGSWGSGQAVVPDGDDSSGRWRGTLDGILILVGEGILSAPREMTDLAWSFEPVSGKANRRDLAFGLFGVFQCGLILQSGSNPSCFARARVIRRGGDVMLDERKPLQGGAERENRCLSSDAEQTCVWLVGRSQHSATKCQQTKDAILSQVPVIPHVGQNKAFSRVMRIASCPPRHSGAIVYISVTPILHCVWMSTIDRIRQATRRQSNEFHAANISTSHGRDRLRLGREMERELGLYSFNNSSADSNGSPRQQHTANDHTRDYSLDYKGGDTDTADSNDFFPRSPAPSTHDLSKHFRDFSMHAIESSIDSVELPRGGKEMGTPEVHLFVAELY